MSDPSSGPTGVLSDLTILGASAIWGIGISQTFKFLNGIHNESRRIVFLVVWMCLADTLREVFSLYSVTTIYLNTTAYFREPPSKSPVALIMVYMFSAISAVSAQLFFMLRIWRIYDNFILIPIVITPVILFQLCVPLVYFQAIPSSSTTSISAQKDLLMSMLVVGAFIDVALSAALCALLWRHYIADGPILQTTKSMLQRMIIFSVNTGMWTALVACMVIVVFFRTAVIDFRIFGYFHILSPLYFATVLANLNARPYLRKQLDPLLPSNLVPLSVPPLVQGELRRRLGTADGREDDIQLEIIGTEAQYRTKRHGSSETKDPTLLLESYTTERTEERHDSSMEA